LQNVAPVDLIAFISARLGRASKDLRLSREVRAGGVGHNSKTVHRTYAKRAFMKIPSLEDYEILEVF
jgi:hypothetical protein